jgi:hypothetical protein
MISMLADLAIENATIWQPDHPVGIYLHPYRVKGVVRYFTEWQGRVYRLNQPLMMASFVAAWTLGSISSSLEERLSKRRRQAVLEKFARGFDEHDEPEAGA